MSEIEKRICRRCKKFRYNRGHLECKAWAKTHTRYSTGEQEVVYQLCDVVNHSGACSMYVYEPTLWESIKTWLGKFNMPGCHWRLL